MAALHDQPTVLMRFSQLAVGSGAYVTLQLLHLLLLDKLCTISVLKSEI